VLSFIVASKLLLIKELLKVMARVAKKFAHPARGFFARKAFKFL